MDLATANTKGVPHEAYKQIELPSSDKEKADIVKKLHQRVVLIKDGHKRECYRRVLLLYDKKDPESFYIESLSRFGVKSRNRVWFHDLEGLMVEELTL